METLFTSFDLSSINMSVWDFEESVGLLLLGVVDWRDVVELVYFEWVVFEILLEGKPNVSGNSVTDEADEEEDAAVMEDEDDDEVNEIFDFLLTCFCCFCCCCCW